LCLRTSDLAATLREREVPAEVFQDVRILAAGISQAKIVAEVLRMKSGALFRGSYAMNVGAGAAIVARLADLGLATPAIREVDIHPVIVSPLGEGALALDALDVAE